MIVVRETYDDLSSRILHSARRRRLRAALVLPDRDAEFAGFVVDIALDTAAAEDEDADRQDFEHRIVALEGSLL